MTLSQLPAAPQQQQHGEDDDDELTVGADEFDALMSAAKRAKSAAAAPSSPVPPPPPLPLPPPPAHEEEEEQRQQQPQPRRRSRRSFPASLVRAASRVPGTDLGVEVAAVVAAAAAPAAPAAAPAAFRPAPPQPTAAAAATDSAPLTYRGGMRYARTPREAEVAAQAILKALGCDDDHGDGDPEGGGGNGAAEGAAPAATAPAAPTSPSCSSSLAVGFDIEWTATFKRGQPPGRVALVQICYETGGAAASGAAAAAAGAAAAAASAPACAAAPNSSSNPTTTRNPPPASAPPPCSSAAFPPTSTTNPPDADAASSSSGRGSCAVVLFHVAHCGVPPALGRLLSDARVLKVGVGVRNDAHKLASDWPGADAWPLGDLGSEAIRRGLFPQNAGGGGGNGVWSLAALARELLPGRPRLPKPQGLRTGSWDGAPLSAAQRQYAAADAFASLAVWRALERVAPLPTASQEALEALARMQERQRAEIEEEEEERALKRYRAVGRAAAAGAAGGPERQ